MWPKLANFAKKEKMKNEVKFINYCKKNDIYFFVDDSGSLLELKKQKEIQDEINSQNKKMLDNDLKAFSLTAISMSKNQIKKGYRLANTIKTQYKINLETPFHRNKMKFNKPVEKFSHLDSDDLWEINKSLNNFIVKNKLSYLSVGRNNLSEIYLGNFSKKDLLWNNIYESFLNGIQKIMDEKYVGKKAIIIFESENGNNSKRIRKSNEIIKKNKLNSIRTIRFMNKINKFKKPNFGIELVDFVNGSSFGYFGLFDFHTHMNNNISFNDYIKNEGIKYIK